jgi:hypothetical protein
MKRMATHLLAEDPPGEGPGQRQALLHRLRPPLCFRDLAATTWRVLDDTKVEPGSSKLFEGGDLMFRGVIIKELLDMPVYTGVGNAGIDVAPVYLLGAQAIGLAIAKRWNTKTKEFDYGDKFGTAIQAIDGYRQAALRHRLRGRHRHAQGLRCGHRLLRRGRRLGPSLPLKPDGRLLNPGRPFPT